MWTNHHERRDWPANLATCHKRKRKAILLLNVYLNQCQKLTQPNHKPETAFLGAVGANTENAWFSTVQLLGTPFLQTGYRSKSYSNF